MSSVNKAIIVGNLGKYPDVKYLPDGKCITNISIATSNKYKDKDGQYQEKTEWHKIVLFNKLAEIAAEYLAKGSKVYIEGSLRTNCYNDKEGNKRYSTEIVAKELQMIGSRVEKKETKEELAGHVVYPDNEEKPEEIKEPANDMDKVPF